jgi:hypothetical protein
MYQKHSHILLQNLFKSILNLRYFHLKIHEKSLGFDCFQTTFNQENLCTNLTKFINQELYRF